MSNPKRNTSEDQILIHRARFCHNEISIASIVEVEKQQGPKPNPRWRVCGTAEAVP